MDTVTPTDPEQAAGNSALGGRKRLHVSVQGVTGGTLAQQKSPRLSWEGREGDPAAVKAGWTGPGDQGAGRSQAGAWL